MQFYGIESPKFPPTIGRRFVARKLTDELKKSGVLPDEKEKKDQQPATIVVGTSDFSIVFEEGSTRELAIGRLGGAASSVRVVDDIASVLEEENVTRDEFELYKKVAEGLQMMYSSSDESSVIHVPKGEGLSHAITVDLKAKEFYIHIKKQGAKGKELGKGAAKAVHHALHISGSGAKRVADAVIRKSDYEPEEVELMELFRDCEYIVDPPRVVVEYSKKEIPGWWKDKKKISREYKDIIDIKKSDSITVVIEKIENKLKELEEKLNIANNDQNLSPKDRNRKTGEIQGHILQLRGLLGRAQEAQTEVEKLALLGTLFVSDLGGVSYHEGNQRDLDQLTHILYTGALGLEYMHEQNYQHGDLKPANIFIKEDIVDGERVLVGVVGDLGTVRRVDPITGKLPPEPSFDAFDEPILDDEGRQKMRTAETKWTEQYAPPECCKDNNEPQSKQGDVWAYGMTIWQSLYAEHGADLPLPIDPTSFVMGQIEDLTQERLNEHLNEVMPAPRNPKEELQQEIIRRCLIIDPNKRMNTQELVLWLKAADTLPMYKIANWLKAVNEGNFPSIEGSYMRKYLDLLIAKGDINEAAAEIRDDVSRVVQGGIDRDETASLNEQLVKLKKIHEIIHGDDQAYLLSMAIKEVENKLTPSRRRRFLGSRRK